MTISKPVSRRYLIEKTAPKVQNVPSAQFSHGWSLLNRVYCHLCDEMLADAHAFGVFPRIVDVDADDDLVAKWDESVPVLLFHDQAVCIHRFDPSAVSVVLAGAPR